MSRRLHIAAVRAAAVLAGAAAGAYGWAATRSIADALAFALAGCAVLDALFLVLTGAAGGVAMLIAAARRRQS